MSLKSSVVTDKNKCEIEVAVDAETFKNAVTKAYRKEVKKINVPGFRKGKAPQAIVEKMYGEEIFFDAAIEETYPDALDAAIKEAGLKVVAVTNLEVLEAKKEDGYTFKAEIVTEPEIDIKDYKGIEAEKKSTEVTDEMIEKEIESVRERNSRMVTVEDRPAEKGDTVVIDFDGYVDGEPFDGGKSENYNLELGSNSFIPGFEDQIVGHSTDEEFSVNVTFPEDYHAENLKGKDAEFKIKLHEIKKKELPEVDDEFVKDVSEKDTLEEYKEELKENIKHRLEHEAEHDLDDKLVNALIEKVEGDIPEEMYDNEVKTMMRDMDMRLRSQGLDMNTYLQYTGMTNESVAEMYKPEAERRVKTRLALEKIAKLENITPTEEDIEAEYKKMADGYQMEVDKVKEILPVESITEDLKVEQAMKFVKDNAKIK